MGRALFVVILVLSLLVIAAIAMVSLLARDTVPVAEVVPLPTTMAAAAITSQTIEVGDIPLPPTFTPIMPTTLDSDDPVLSTTAPTQQSPESMSISATSLLVTTEAAASAPASAPTAAETPILIQTPSSVATRASLPCLESVPEIPAYGRYVLADEIWPSRNGDVSDTHFWLSRPFDVESGFQINQAYPYGNDLNGRLLLHNGVDAVELGGTPLVAVADGTVVVAQDDRAERFGWRCSWYGQLIVLQLDQTWMGQPIYALYGHVLQLSVEAGARVSRGDQIAVIGSGGAATVPHLHFEVRVGANEFGATRNPLLWVDPAPNGVIAGRLLDPTGRPWQGVGLSLIGKSEDASEANTWSYMSDPLAVVAINTDAGVAENFVFGDVRPGEYDVYTRIQGVEYRTAVAVRSGQVSVIEITTEPYKTSTPAP